MNYTELLKLPAWRLKRQEVLYRDNWVCQNCGKLQKVISVDNDDNIVLLPEEERVHLQVHHKVYRNYCLPYEQPDEDLISLCEKCHQEHHETSENIILDINGNLVDEFEFCKRCGGNGYIKEYKHVENGICFRCRNRKVIPRHINRTFEVKPAIVDFNQISLKIDNFGMNDLINKLDNNIDKNNFNEFLDRLKLIIEFLHISVFDENFVIIGDYLKQDRDHYLIVQLDKKKILTYHDIGKDWHFALEGAFKNINTWLKKIKRFYYQLEDNEKVIGNQNSSLIPAKYLKQKNEVLLYKAALDKSFRYKLLDEVMR